MSDEVLTVSPVVESEGDHPRRAVVFAATPTAETLVRHLSEAGYETLLSSAQNATQSLKDFSPQVALIEVRSADGENGHVALARRLRAEPATYSLPLVFLVHDDERSLRSAALNIGVDDYLPASTPPAELRARLDALFWRAEVGRRAAPTVGEQRSEIDNFLLLLDAVRADAQRGLTGTVGLIEAVAREGTLKRADRDQTLIEAYGFFKLNLRRVDAAAFYGPMTLLVYLPRSDAPAARNALARLRDEFLASRPDSDLALGLSSFPEDDGDVEGLVTKAEIAIGLARVPGAPQRVVTYKAEARPTEPVAPGPGPAQQTRESSPAQRPPESAHHPLPSRQIVRESKIVEAFNISLARAPGVGGGAVETTDALGGVAAEAAARERERRASGAIMPRRLLLTVSNPARMAQLNLLIRSAGYEVRAAFDGQQALNLLRIERPDLLLLDYELHDIDGLEALRRLRKQSGGRITLPVVLLLPEQHEAIRREAFDVGARGIVIMPYDPAELLTSVRTVGAAE